MLKKLFILMALCAVNGSQLVHAEEASAPQDGHARVRFFGQAVISMTFYPDKSCYGGKGVQTSRSGFGGFFGSTKSISIGMPETPEVLNLKDRDGILSKAFYREYAVSADKPLTIIATMAQSTGRHMYSCEKIGGFFIPENGKDYEVTFDYGNDTCQVNVAQIDTADAEVRLLPVKTSMVAKCSAKD
ncbi:MULTISPECIES: hypothetical protein [unclassified Herbaspirillum]|jgi:hypothetical protein|uniref:hypothetical protein n=1 Tax=unclassified Herbaspirillum TaxID=2624150 RepID=UPI000E2F28F2|nr:MULTISPECIES: hypothetical protein [unclassified Herbaspirillum]RFB68006.1 hypothetical protein DZB54_18230 [Herbaspirillum sp. 3R-3a1]TFI06447.1 hypothetical protein E4P32_19170 [Herbaspirillum sp. 3R11]TFI13941.1 hypothetical protein E4P31_14295 [Herbaspirillum sp. 3R-11]TFI29839.1 hypothetical protein E4P30_05110 [Herbaspirillum sp. 3C11]